MTGEAAVIMSVFDSTRGAGAERTGVMQAAKAAMERNMLERCIFVSWGCS